MSREFFNKKNIILFKIGIPIIILIVAIYLRLSSQRDHMQWLDDSARDVIVAEKIKNENRWFELKPQSGGIYDLKNLTLYFDSLGFLKITAPNINVFFSLYLLFYSLSLVAGFFIGYLIGDWFLGVVYLLILTFNAHLIFVQISVYQRYPPASVILWIVLSSILLINKKKNKYLIPILILALFSFLLHLSLLSVFPVFLIIISLSILKRIEVNNNVLRFGIFTTGIFALIICWLTISKNNLTTIIKSVSIPDETSRISSSASVYPYFKTFLVDLFNHPLNSFLLIISLFCFLFLLPLIYWKSKNNSLLIYAVYSYSLFPLFAFAHIFKNKILVENFYLEHYRTLFLVFIPTTLYLSFKSKTFYKNRLLRLLFFVGFVYITSFIIVMNRTLQPTHEYILSKKISEFIQADAKQLNIGIQDKQWIILDQSDWAETGWFSPSLWYFFPQEEKDDHLFLRNLGNNLLFQTKGEATVIYLLCHHFFDSSYTPINLSSPIDINEICLDEFIAHEEYSPYNYLSENFAKKTL